MASSTATGLIMPVSRPLTRGYPSGSPEAPGYREWYKGTNIAQPGAPGDDATLDQPDTLDDEMFSSTEVGVIAIPAFPLGAGPMKTPAHAIQYSTNLRVKYVMNNSKYVQNVLPTPVDDAATGLLAPEDDEFYSDSASYAEHDKTQAAKEARNAGTGAHQVNQIMSDTEISATGATGVWSIAGRTGP